jgi:hypothetical protein
MIVANAGLAAQPRGSTNGIFVPASAKDSIVDQPSERVHDAAFSIVTAPNIAAILLRGGRIAWMQVNSIDC